MTAIALYRVPRRLVRKAVKPLVLWLNAWRYKQSESEVDKLNSIREDASRLMRAEHQRQVKLAVRRNEIVRW